MRCTPGVMPSYVGWIDGGWSSSDGEQNPCAARSTSLAGGSTAGAGFGAAGSGGGGGGGAVASAFPVSFTPSVTVSRAASCAGRCAAPTRVFAVAGGPFFFVAPAPG